MQFLKQATASQIVILGPFLDSTDGVSLENALSIANTDILVNKHGLATLVAKNSGGATVIGSSGYYQATLDATDTSAAGRLTIAVTMSGALPVWHEFTVLPALVFDSLVLGSDNLQVDAAQWLGTAIVAGSIPAAAAGQASGLPIIAPTGGWLNVANLPQAAPGGTSGLAVFQGEMDLIDAPNATALEAIAAAAGALDVDSTEEGLTLKKAIEALVAACLGKAAYDADTGTVTFRGRDGATTIVTVTAAQSGNRTASSIN